jgi:hypothetical protein
MAVDKQNPGLQQRLREEQVVMFFSFVCNACFALYHPGRTNSSQISVSVQRLLRGPSSSSWLHLLLGHRLTRPKSVALVNQPAVFLQSPWSDECSLTAPGKLFRCYVTQTSVGKHVFVPSSHCSTSAMASPSVELGLMSTYNDRMQVSERSLQTLYRY